MTIKRRIKQQIATKLKVQETTSVILQTNCMEG